MIPAFNALIIKARNSRIIVDIRYAKSALYIKLGCTITLSKAIFRFLPRSFACKVSVELRTLPK
jgi:hypothetical protein